MLESDFAGLGNYEQAEIEEIRPRMRSYQVRIKQRKSDLEDYELSTKWVTQNRSSGRAASEK
jgi:hypothetical protein